MSTQLIKAKAGVITPEMEEAARYEQVNPEWLRNEIASGRCVIPKNINHRFAARAIGNGITTKVNANIGTSSKHCNLTEELEKLDISVQYGASAIMDLSTGGDLRKILKTILTHSPVMVGTVPIYTTVAKQKNGSSDSLLFDPEALFEEIEQQAMLGVDFMTLHCAITRNSIRFLESSPRITGMVSRGGTLIYNYIKQTGRENPLYEHYERVLDICRKYDVTLSLGDGLRPGCGADSNDASQIEELIVQGELVVRARNKGVQIIVEGPGHMPLNRIKANMQLMKRLCHDAPLYVLGPLTTDSSAGYDHITAAIGGAVAASNGANFLCYVTPAEHLCLPNKDDVKQGVIASKIAAHSADIANGIESAVNRDLTVSDARARLCWGEMFDNLLEPQLARKRKTESESSAEDYCTMCGELCAMKTYYNSSK